MSNEFRTRRLYLASYLDATMAMRFLRTEYEYGKVVFIFADPHLEGPDIERSYEGGAVCPAIAIFSSLTRMRRAMTDHLRQVTGENREYQSRR